MTDREIVARALCRRAGYDPDETWEEYDRNAAATVSTCGEYEGWQNDVFPKCIRWHQFLPDADAAIAVLFPLWKERAAKVDELTEALRLADAALRGSNMNMRVVERKVNKALGR